MELIHPVTEEPVPAGVTGDVVVTDLLNASMPFLRYAVGDIGVLASEPCPCGRCSPTLLLFGTQDLPTDARSKHTGHLDSRRTATHEHLYADHPTNETAR